MFLYCLILSFAFFDFIIDSVCNKKWLLLEMKFVFRFIHISWIELYLFNSTNAKVNKHPQIHLHRHTCMHLHSQFYQARGGYSLNL